MQLVRIRMLTGLLLMLIVVFVLSTAASAHPGETPVDFYETIFQQHGAVMMLIDPESGEIVYANNAASDYYGYPTDTLQAMQINRINLLSAEEIESEMRLAEAEQRNYFLFKHRLADGQIRDVEVYSYPVDVDGRTLLFSVITDITDQLAAEAIIQRERQIQQVFLIAVVLGLLAGVAILAIVNRQRKAAIRSMNELYQMQQTVADISLKFIASEPDDLERLFGEAMDACGPLFKIDRSFISLIADDQSSRERIFSWYRPGIPRQEVRNKVQYEEIPWVASRILDRQTVCIEDIDQMPLEASREQIYFRSQGIRSKCLLPLVVGDQVMAVWAMDSLATPMDCSAANKSIRAVLAGIFAASLERRRAVERRVFWQNLLGYIIEFDPNSIAVLDKDMNFMYTSRKFLLDYHIREPEIIGKNHYELFPGLPEHFKAVHQRVLAGETMTSDEEVFRHADGNKDFTRYLLRPWYRHDGQVGGIVMYLEIITERKRQEQKRIDDLSQYRQQQKLESIGTLASGVAHEINNPIMGIINYAQLILDESQNPNIQGYAEEIMTEGKRVSSITGDLLFFSRQQKQSHSPADINDIIRRTLGLIDGLMKRDQIEVILDLAEDLPQLKCRSQQIQQIMMNLLTNARDALNEKHPKGNPDKLISLSTGLFEEGGRRWIRITVEDHGIGMTAETQEQLFDPFFTTKPRDVGTGLGLPISFGIARDHHGRLTFASEAGQYTRFYLELPVDNGWHIEEGESK